MRQVNPIIDPFVWESCRPIRSSSTNTNNGAISKAWADTYDLICNSSVPIFPNNRTNSFVSNKLSEVQKLCIVLSMHRESNVRSNDKAHYHEIHQDFTYAPTHCLNGQPCMILQERYFRLVDPKPVMAWGNNHKQHKGRTTTSALFVKDIITEISTDEYNAWRFIHANTIVRVHEVAFDSKGKRSANQSIWFDSEISPCSNNKAKKLSKKGEDHWQMNDRSGALFCMPKNETFEANLPSIVPYVSMQPVDDSRDGLDFIDGVIEQ